MSTTRLRRTWKILICDGSQPDVALLTTLLEETFRNNARDFEIKSVGDEGDFSRALDEFTPDIVLTAFQLPDTDGQSIINLTRLLSPDIPIIVTGVLGDEAAANLIQAGAADYALKSNLKRLPDVIEKSILAAETRIQFESMTDELHVANLQKFTIAKYAHDAVIMMDENGKISFWNSSAERLFGYSESEAIGSDLHSLLTPERDRPRAVKGLKEFARSGQGPVVGAFRKVIALRKDHTEFPAEISLSAIQINGEWHAVGIVRDLNECLDLISNHHTAVVQATL